MLRSWRERLAPPEKAPEADSGDGVGPQTKQTKQTPLSFRVGLRTEESANPKQTPDPCVISGCTEPIADGDLVYCQAHRAKADDGTLWAPVVERQRLVRTGPNTWIEADWARGLCVFCDQPTAAGDLITCPTHRAKMDAIVMPWESR